MDTEPIKKLLRKYNGNLLIVPTKELVEALKKSDGEFEILINQAESEYRKEQEKSEKPE